MIFQYHREKRIRIDALNSRLNDMTNLVNNYIRVDSLTETGNYILIDSIFNLIPLTGSAHNLIAMMARAL